MIDEWCRSRGPDGNMRNEMSRRFEGGGFPFGGFDFGSGGVGGMGGMGGMPGPFGGMGGIGGFPGPGGGRNRPGGLYDGLYPNADGGPDVRREWGPEIRRESRRNRRDASLYGGQGENYGRRPVVFDRPRDGRRVGVMDEEEELYWEMFARLRPTPGGFDFEAPPRRWHPRQPIVADLDEMLDDMLDEMRGPYGGYGPYGAGGRGRDPGPFAAGGLGRGDRAYPDGGPPGRGGGSPPPGFIFAEDDVPIPGAPQPDRDD